MSLLQLSDALAVHSCRECLTHIAFTNAWACRCEHETAGNDGLHLAVALSYGARQDITAAVSRIAKLVAEGILQPSEVRDKHVYLCGVLGHPNLIKLRFPTIFMVIVAGNRRTCGKPFGDRQTCTTAAQPRSAHTHRR